MNDKAVAIRLSISGTPHMHVVHVAHHAQRDGYTGATLELQTPTSGAAE